MVAPLPTDWHFEPTDAVDRDGRKVVIPWATGMDAPVALDVADALDDGETLADGSLSASLWKLQAYGETDNTDVTASSSPDYLPGSVSYSGTTLIQRLANLERGRVYRLYFTFGAASNIRKRSIVIDVSRT